VRAAVHGQRRVRAGGPGQRPADRQPRGDPRGGRAARHRAQPGVGLRQHAGRGGQGRRHRAHAGARAAVQVRRGRSRQGRGGVGRGRLETGRRRGGTGGRPELVRGDGRDPDDARRPAALRQPTTDHRGGALGRRPVRPALRRVRAGPEPVARRRGGLRGGQPLVVHVFRCRAAHVRRQRVRRTGGPEVRRLRQLQVRHAGAHRIRRPAHPRAGPGHLRQPPGDGHQRRRRHGGQRQPGHRLPGQPTGSEPGWFVARGSTSGCVSWLPVLRTTGSWCPGWTTTRRRCTRPRRSSRCCSARPFQDPGGRSLSRVGRAGWPVRQGGPAAADARAA